MTDIYADGQLATGSNNGTSWADAYRGAAGLQSAFDAALAADVVHMARTFNLSVPIDVDQHSGTDGSPVRVVGYNYNGGSPVIDGTKAVIDAADTAARCLNVSGVDHWRWENLEFANATGDNVYAADYEDYHQFLRCDSHGAGGAGWSAAANRHWRQGIWVYCRSYGNASGCGWDQLGYNTTLYGCSAIDNGSYGFSAIISNCAFVGCVAHHNGDTGFRFGSANMAAIGCVSDGNTQHGFRISYAALIARCRATNNGGYGLYADSATVTELDNFYSGNGTAATGGSTPLPDDKGASTRITSGAAGYENLAGDKLNLRLGAAGWRVESDMGGGNYLRTSVGLPTSIVPQIAKAGGRQ